MKESNVEKLKSLCKKDNGISSVRNESDELLKKFTDQVGGVTFVLPENVPILSYPIKYKMPHLNDFDPSVRTAKAISINVKRERKQKQAKKEAVPMPTDFKQKLQKADVV